MSKGIEGHFSECVKDAGLHHDRAPLETRPQFKPGASSWALLRMRQLFDGIEKIPHPEEAAQRPSRKDALQSSSAISILSHALRHVADCGEGGWLAPTFMGSPPQTTRCGQRDPDTVIALLDRAGEMVNGPQQTYWLADQKGTRAKALALLGRQDEATEALRSFVDLASTATPRNPIAGLWKDDQIHFAESWVYACAGDEARADEARDRVLAYSGDYQYAANVRLHGAHAAVVNGGYETGIKRAVDILTALPPSQQSHMITETARNVLRAVPLDQHDRPAVRDLRALPSGSSPSALT